MCTGIELIGLAASAASGIGSMIQQKEEQANARRMAKARNDELKRTLGKNDALAQDSREQFNLRQQELQKAQLEEQNKDTRREDELVEATETPAVTAEGGDVAAPISGSAPTVVKSELAKRMQGALDQSKSQAQKLGKLGGYGDTWLDQGFADMETGRNLGVNSNFAAGNSALLPYAQDFAEQRAYKPISPIGGLLQGFGSMASSWAGSRAGGGAVPRKQYQSGYI